MRASRKEEKEKEREYEPDVGHNDPFRVLGVTPSSSKAEIKKAYYGLARRYHTDKLVGLSEDRMAAANEVMQRINLAYNVLTDPRKRKQYESERYSTAREDDDDEYQDSPEKMGGLLFSGPRPSEALRKQIKRWMDVWNVSPQLSDQSNVRATVASILEAEEKELQKLPRSTAVPLAGWCCETCGSKFYKQRDLYKHFRRDHNGFSELLKKLDARAPASFREAICCPPEFAFPYDIDQTLMNTAELDNQVRLVTKQTAHRLWELLPQAIRALVQDAKGKSRDSEDSVALPKPTCAWLEFVQSSHRSKVPHEKRSSPSSISHHIPSASQTTAKDIQASLLGEEEPRNASEWFFCFMREVKEPTQAAGSSIPLVNPRAFPSPFHQCIPRVVIEDKPEWEPDSKSWTCHVCKEKKGFPDARHHCRNCGYLVCTACSTQRRRVPRYGYTYTQRVCEPCIQQTIMWEMNLFEQHILQNPSHRCHAELVALLSKVYSTEHGGNNWLAVAEQLLKEKMSEQNLPVILCCFKYGNADTRRWFDLATTLEGEPLLRCVSASLNSGCVKKGEWVDFSFSLKHDETVEAIYNILDLKWNDLDDIARRWHESDHFILSWRCHVKSSVLKPDKRSWTDRASQYMKAGKPELSFQCALIGKFGLEEWYQLGQIAYTKPIPKELWICCLEHLSLLQDMALRFVDVHAETAAQLLERCGASLDVWMGALNGAITNQKPPSDIAHYALHAFRAGGLEKVREKHDSALLTITRLVLESVYEVVVESTATASSTEFWWTLALKKIECAEDLLAHLCFVARHLPGTESVAQTWANAGAHFQNSDYLQQLSPRCFINAALFDGDSERLLAIADHLLQLGHPECALQVLGHVRRVFPRQVPPMCNLLLANCLDYQAWDPPLLKCAYKYALTSLAEGSPESVRCLAWIQEMKELVAEQKKEEAKQIALRVQKRVQKAKAAFDRREWADLIAELLSVWRDKDVDVASAIANMFVERASGNEERLGLEDKSVLSLSRAIEALLNCDANPRGVQIVAPTIELALDQLVTCALALPFVPTFTEGVVEILSAESTRLAVVDTLRHSLRKLQTSIAKHNSEFVADVSPLLASTSMQLPAEQRFIQMLRSSPAVVALSRCERGIKREFVEEPMSAAFHYFDLICAAPDSTSSASCLILAARAFLMALQCSAHDAERFAIKNALLSCLQSAAELGSHQSPDGRIYIARLSTAIILRAIACAGHTFSPDPEEELTLLKKFIHTTTTLAPIFPALCMPTVYACDSLVTGLVFNRITNGLLQEYGSSQSSPLLPPQEVAYQLLEGRWHGWLRDEDLEKEEMEDRKLLADSDDDEEDTEKCEKIKEEEDEDEAQKQARKLELQALVKERERQRKLERKKREQETREVCMSELLHSNRWSAKEVEGLVQSLPLPRDESGFLLPHPEGMGRENEFYSLDGYEFDSSTGRLKILAVKADPSKGKPNLFSWADVAEVLRLGVSEAFFTLDEPDQSHTIHPFQKMGFHPPSLKDTLFLATMFQTDYLLKFFSTGVEVSGMAPFALRGIEEGLLQQLPEYLHEKVGSIVHASQGHRQGKAHRFWIEAGKIPVQIEGTNDNLSCHFGYVPMYVKKHLLVRDTDGKLTDAPVDDTSDDSPEAEFARNFTRYYDEIGASFPEFLRLRELLKIAAMYTHINSIAAHFSETYYERNDTLAQARLRSREAHKAHLSKTRAKTGSWPVAEDSSAVDEIVEKTVEGNRDMVERQGFSWWSAKAEVERQVRPKVIQQIKEADAKTLQEITNQFSARLGSVCSWSDVQDAVRTWLRYRDASTLANHLADADILDEKHKLWGLLGGLRGMGFKIVENEERTFSMSNQPRSDTTCCWVPASFCKEQKLTSKAISLVYGGVALNVSFINARLINPPPTSQYFLAPQTLNSQRALAAPNSNAQMVDNLRLANQAFFNNLQHNNNRNAGNRYQQERRREAMADPKLGRADRGWFQQEYNRVQSGQASSMRMPPGKQFAHYVGFERAKGYDYRYTHLQDTSLHRLQHRHDKHGKSNAEASGVYREYMMQEVARRQAAREKYFGN